MLELSLDREDEEVLIWALEGVISDLGAEIADTDNLEFREDLKGRKARLRTILQRLR